ncbi:MAG TPA: hypothetical protein VGL80_32555 [Pseudonocardiaceae bacterium]
MATSSDPAGRLCTSGSIEALDAFNEAGGEPPATDVRKDWI